MAMIRDHGLCQTPGCHMPAQEVHHIIELTPENIHDPRVSLRLDNLRCLCRECHMRMHREKLEEPRYVFDAQGNLIVTPDSPYPETGGF